MSRHWIIERVNYYNIPSEDFFMEIDEVCKKYNVSISHEDGHGGFIIDEYSENNLDWLRGASFFESAVKSLEEYMRNK